jgi:hypothetical protein
MAKTKTTKTDNQPYCNRCVKPAHATAIMGPYQLCGKCASLWYLKRDQLLQGELAKFVRGGS